MQSQYTTVVHVEFGPDHPAHSKIPWSNDSWECSYPIKVPQPFIPYLYSNDPISPETHHLARQVKDRLSASIQRDEAEIDAVQQHLNNLMNRCESSKKTLFACDVLLSPMRRIPNDVLHEMALQCKPKTFSCSDDDDFPTFMFSKYHTPSILSQVSSTWRSTVQNISSLWQFMCIDCNDWARGSLDDLRSRVEHFCQLSKSQPLYVRLEDWDHFGEDESDRRASPGSGGLGRVLGWILTQWPHVDRLAKLYIKPFDYKDVPKILKRWCGQYGSSPSDTVRPLPSVDSLLLLWSTKPHIFQSSNFKWSTDDLNLIFYLFPNLRLLWLGKRSQLLRNRPGTNSSQPFFRTVTLPSSISVLFFEVDVPYQDWVALLEACPCIQWAYFCVSDIRNDRSTTPIVHYGLKEMTLCIQDLRPGLSLSVLQPFVNLQFPNLAVLHLHLATFTPFDPVEGDRGYLRPERFINTFPSLDTLRVSSGHHGDTVNSTQVLSPLLLSVPSITSFHFASTKLPQIVSVQNYINQEGTLVLPNLQRFTIRLDDRNTGMDSLERAFTRSFLGSSSSAPTTQSVTPFEERAVREGNTANIEHAHNRTTSTTSRLAGIRHQIQLVVRGVIDKTRMRALERRFELHGIYIRFQVVIPPEQDHRHWGDQDHYQVDLGFCLTESDIPCHISSMDSDW